jgi:hypothetical protein
MINIKSWCIIRVMEDKNDVTRKTLIIISAICIGVFVIASYLLIFHSRLDSKVEFICNIKGGTYIEEGVTASKCILEESQLKEALLKI